MSLRRPKPPFRDGTESSSCPPGRVSVRNSIGFRSNWRDDFRVNHCAHRLVCAEKVRGNRRMNRSLPAGRREWLVLQKNSVGGLASLANDLKNSKKIERADTCPLYPSPPGTCSTDNVQSNKVKSNELVAIYALGSLLPARRISCPRRRSCCTFPARLLVTSKTRLQIREPKYLQRCHRHERGRAQPTFQHEVSPQKQPPHWLRCPVSPLLSIVRIRLQIRVPPPRQQRHLWQRCLWQP